MPSLFTRISQALQKQKPVDSANASASRTALLSGALINDRYRIDSELGRGGMGIVYRARDLPHDRHVAIKVINPERMNALTRLQFLHEAEISARLSHPHLIAVHETGLIDPGMQEPLPYIVMELVQGTLLSEMGRFTIARILEIGIQICEALEYIHEQGLVYRDLKPGNVLVEKRGFHDFARLMDFGLTHPRGMANLPNESSVDGTLFYLAPELIAGKPADLASDLYALGATLYEMITGRVPFSDFDQQTILSQHLETPVTPPSHSRTDIPPALEGIVLRLLAKEPAERFASAREVCTALERIRLTHRMENAQGNLNKISPDLTVCESGIAEVKKLIESNRLVTLLGDGEMIALASGRQLASYFSDGVWYVDFTPVDHPSQVLGTVTSTIGVPLNPDRPLTVSLVDHMQEKNLLLLLIHCDRLVSACAQLAETILHTCPDIYILATSSQPLHISGEKCYP